MYRQISIVPDQRKYQRILWRNSPEDPIAIYDLNTVTYGVGPSAYQAIRYLRQLAVLEFRRFPLAKKFVEENMYVDDILLGSHFVDSAVDLTGEIQEFFMLGGFPF